MPAEATLEEEEGRPGDSPSIHPSIHPSTHPSSTARVVKHSRSQTNSLALSALRDRETARREAGKKEDIGMIGGDLHLRGQPWLARDSDPCYRVRCP